MGTEDQTNDHPVLEVARQIQAEIAELKTEVRNLQAELNLLTIQNYKLLIAIEKFLPRSRP